MKTWILIFILILPTKMVLANQKESTSEAAFEKNKSNEEAAKIVLENNKINSLTGSESKISMQLISEYQGSSINAPFAADRPNPNSDVVTPKSQFNNSLSGVYRFNKVTAMSLGIGHSFISPNKSLGNSEVSNPFLRLTRLFKIRRSVDSSLTLQVKYFTARDRSNGRDMGFNINNYSAYSIPGSNFTIGAEIEYGYKSFIFYNKNDFSWGWTFAPLVEYQINKSLNLSWITFLGGAHDNYNPTYLGTSSDIVVSQLGFGYQIMEGVFLNPSIEFQPSNIRPELATVNFSAIYNLF